MQRTHLGFRVARAEDFQDDVSEKLLSRLLTPVAKFWNCQRVFGVTEEVIQSIGGNAYIEEHPCPRYYREAPLNAIWEDTSRYLVTRMALAVQAALLVQNAPNVVADAFIASRLGTGWGPGYGTLRNVDFESIIDFARLG